MRLSSWEADEETGGSEVAELVEAGRGFALPGEGRPNSRKPGGRAEAGARKGC